MTTPIVFVRQFLKRLGDKPLHLFVLAFGLLVSVRAAVSKPNIILIVADDLGYADLGCYGAKTIVTPRLDRMAREGIRFTDAYAAAPFCSPSRAGLLTGRLPARAGLPYVLFPVEHHGLPAEEITLAEMLKQQGYATACIGKWHLGWEPRFRPQRQGFDVFFGTPYSNDSNEWPVGARFMQVMGLVPFPLIDGHSVVEAPADQSQLTRHYTERAVAFIHENRARPFFLYLPHTMPHIPQYTRPEFAGKSKAGLYGDTVEEIDWSTGVILDALEELRIADRTLVIFTSDNGAPIRRAQAARGGKSTVKTPPKNPPPGTERFPGRSHAGSNAPLRSGKGTTFEGGIRVPFIVRWAGTIFGGREEAAPISHLDVFPTCAALAGSELRNDRNYDGQDLGTRFEHVQRTAPLVHYFGYQLQALRDGNWKFFPAVTGRPEPRPPSLWWEHQPQVFDNQHRLLAQPELYDLSRDPGETQNVAAQNLEVVERLTVLAQLFDAALQKDCRPMEFATGPTPPAPQTVRKADTDLTEWRKLHAP